MNLAPGSTFGPYKILEPLGRGGMASVFKAYEPGLDRYVALKVLPAESVQDEASAERFRREAKVIARLEHPNITPIHSFGIDERTQVPWMAMRLISGGTLSSRLTMRITPPRAVGILRGVADALDYAHGKGVMHRDVKPANILLDEAGRVYLADFGIARLVEGATALTAAGLISGTPAYMAPEQATGAALDHRLDIYALGVVAYEVLAGRVPFPGDNPIEVLMKHVQAAVPDVPDVTPEVMDVLEKALAKRPEDRYESAGALISALETAIATMPEVGTHPTQPGAAVTVAPASRTGVSPRTRITPAGPPTGAGPTVIVPTSAPHARPDGNGSKGLAAVLVGAGVLVSAVVLAGFLFMRSRDQAVDEPPPSTLREQAAAVPSTMAPPASLADAITPPPTPPVAVDQRPATSPRPSIAPSIPPRVTAPASTPIPAPMSSPRIAAGLPPATAVPVTVPPTTSAPAPAAIGTIRLDVNAVQPAFGAQAAAITIDVEVDGRTMQSVTLRFDGTTAFARSRRRQAYDVTKVPVGRKTVGVTIRADGGVEPIRASTQVDLDETMRTLGLDVRLRGNGEGDARFR